jgi:hypothetical protein
LEQKKATKTKRRKQPQGLCWQKGQNGKQPQDNTMEEGDAIIRMQMLF